MKALILCAGYATRLYPLTLNQPKHLLPIASRPMLNHSIDKLEEIDEIDEIYIVTNNKFFPAFEKWSKTLHGKKKIQVFNDGSMTDGKKLGAVGDMQFVIKKANIKDDIMVLAGDNLFKLNLKDFISFYRKKGTTIALYDVKDKELMKQYGEVELAADKSLVSFREKPQDPKTTLAAICIYLFPKEKLQLIEQYIAEGNNPDQPGRYIQWIYKREKVFGFVFQEKWYDIGDLTQYKEADEEYKREMKI